MPLTAQDTYSTGYRDREVTGSNTVSDVIDPVTPDFDTGPIVTEDTGIFSPSLFLSSLTFGAIDQEVFEGYGADRVTTIGEVSDSLQGGDGSGRRLADKFRLLGAFLLVGAVIITLGQLFTINIGDSTS